MTIRIAIAGAAGRMGQALARTAATAATAATVVGGSEREGAPQIGQDIGLLAGLPALGAVITESPARAAATADAWIDFTVPAATLAALEALKTTAVKAAVIGATGWSPHEEAAIAVHARRIPIVKSGNFSLGVNMLLSLIEQAAERLGPDWDIEIAETHHRRKIDAPSGTALMMGEAAATGRGSPLDALRSAPYSGVTGPRETGRIGFSVSRAGGVIGDHEAVFASDEELLILGHRALDRALFARGALHAARWAINQSPGLYSMRDVLAL
jgi:4-hydroxy-tetrahydrodipicolinate reductase